VTFHNEEPFNAEAAKFAIDFQGDAGNGHLSHSYTDVVSAEVVDDYTVDVVCQVSCPIYPKTAFFTRFQAPAWYKAASEAEQVGMTVGFGPYQLKEWRRGESITMTAYENYLARTDVAEAQMPHIKEMTQLYRGEATVRAAMVQTGEADWAFEIGFENAEAVPKAVVGGTAEMAALKVDTLWHPALQKKEVRQALVHAMDCQTIVQSLYDGRVTCTGNSAPAGTLGLTPENSEPYEYNPARAKELLEQAGYNGEEIALKTQVGRFYRDVELVEAIVGYWIEAGINAKVEALELGIHSDLGRSGCGRYEDKALECMNLSPPPPGNASPHVITSTPSLETLDFAKIAIQTLSCSSIRSFVCEPDRLEPLITQAIAATGEERKAQMERLATILHDDVLIIGLFELVAVYGMNEDLIWEPRYDRRVRLNMMSFKQ
jgi:peptide/nickel transport system substrate-binding protein